MTELREMQKRAAEAASRPFRATEPRVVLADVDFEHGAAQHHISKGTVVHIVPGSEMEQRYGGAGNLGPMTSAHRGGVSN